MSCVLRISGPALPGALPPVALTPYRFERGTAHFLASEADASDLPAQVNDALAFLETNRGAITTLLASPETTAELDFATEYEPGAFTSHTLPARLVQLAAALRLDLTISGYPRSGFGDGEA